MLISSMGAFWSFWSGGYALQIDDLLDMCSMELYSFWFYG